MFSFLRENKIDATPYMRRIIDLTTPNLQAPNEAREKRRYNRALATCLCPWSDGSLDIKKISIGITKDLSDNGVCVLTTSRFGSAEVLLTFLVECEFKHGLSFFLATIEREHRLGGFVEYGLSISEYLNDNHHRDIKKIKGMIIDSYQHIFCKGQ